MGTTRIPGWDPMADGRCGGAEPPQARRKSTGIARVTLFRRIRSRKDALRATRLARPGTQRVEPLIFLAHDRPDYERDGNGGTEQQYRNDGQDDQLGSSDVTHGSDGKGR